MVESTKLNEEKRYEQYSREMEYLDKLQIANTGDFNKAIRYFSGFAIPLILTIIDISQSRNSAICVSEGIFLFAILCSVAAHFFSDFGIDKRRGYVELFWIHERHEYRFKQHILTKLGWYSSITSFIAFLFGVGLFIWFLINGSIIIKGA